MQNNAVSAFPFKAVIFDMDGVIVDTEMAYAYETRDFLASQGVTVSMEELYAQVGRSHQDFCETLVDWLGRAGENLGTQEALARFDAWEDSEPLDYAKLLNPGVREALEGLAARGVRLAVASSSPLDNIHQVLTECEILDAFEFVTSGEQFVRSNPDPEIYLHVLDALGLSARECCCVEDSAPGIAAGKAAGLTVVAKREERFGFSQDEADYVVDRVSDILTLEF